MEDIHSPHQEHQEPAKESISVAPETPSPSPSPVHHMGQHGEKSLLSSWAIGLLIVLVVLVVVNQIFLISFTSSLTGTRYGGSSSIISLQGGTDLKDIDINQIESTAQGIAALFPIDQIKTSEDAIAIMVPTGTPEYGEAMGVSFDNPVESMELMARGHPALEAQIEQDPEKWARFLNLAAEPRGVSCEFCCGIGPTGADKNGKSKCGCQHNPAMLALTQWLLLNTDYSDAEILREVYRWKVMFFPRDMVGLASQIAGGDTKVLEDLPGMVGGC